MAHPVTVETFLRAETDHYIRAVAGQLGTGVWQHRRAPADVAHQDVIRMNRDTLYSLAVLDLDAGDATVTLPDPGGRFQSLQVVDQDHFTPGCTYGPGTVTLTRDSVGTRYAVLIARTFLDPDDPADLDGAHALQDALGLDAPVLPLDLPEWDETTLSIVRGTLLAVAPAILGDAVAFGARGEVDPARHLVSTAAGWGGNTARDAMYVGVFPERNDGTTPHRITVGDVPVDGFWSISVYGPDGFFVANDEGRYSVNDVTAEKDPDGRVTVTFGGDGPNRIPVVPGWNYIVRLYRPRPEILDGSWTFPEAVPV
jgi:hypothetical protein